MHEQEVAMFITKTERVTLVDIWHSALHHQDIYRLRRSRDGRVADIREGSLQGALPPEALKARLQAGETVEVAITARRSDPYHWTAAGGAPAPTGPLRRADASSTY